MMRLNLIITATIVLAGFSSVAAQTGADPCADTKTKLTQAENRLKDWPQLARYHDANGKLAPAAKNETRVVFMGDSITDSWQNPKFGGFFPGKPYVDRGISGQTTPQMLIRFRPDVIALRPKVVVILAGTNDLAGNTGPMALETIEDNLTSMADLAEVVAAARPDVLALQPKVVVILAGTNDIAGNTGPMALKRSKIT